MYIVGKHYNRKAVSQVIAALLLIAIAVAAAVLVYVFSIGLLGSLQSSGGQQARQQVIMEAYDWSANTTLLMHLRNVGPADVNIASIYVNGQAPSNISPALPAAVGVGDTLDITLTFTGGYSPGVSYVIKLVSVDGAVFSYSAIAGSAG